MINSPRKPPEFDSELETQNKLDRFNQRSNAGSMLILALLQMISTVAFSGVMYYGYGIGASLSAFFGGSIAALMSAFMAARMYTTHRIAAVRIMTANERLARFYATALLKVLFTLLMMGILIAVIKVSMLPFIIAYLISAVLVNWCYLLFADA